MSLKKVKLDYETYQAVIRTPFAVIGLFFENDILVSVHYLDDNAQAKQSASVQVKKIVGQIERYSLFNTVFNFDIVAQPSGTLFQRKVLAELMRIPYGKTLTYGDIAKRLKTSPRAVGNACRRNPIPLIIPCHRVVAANSLGGYDGDTSGGKINIKRYLLENEANMLSKHSI